MISILLYLVSFLSVFQMVAPGSLPATTEIVDFDGLERYLEQYHDQTVVVNFWATWCAPCVRELPYFEEATAYYSTEDVRVILVSLDFKKHIERKLVPFLDKHKLRSDVIVLYDPDANQWIDKVDPTWSGAIPATWIRCKDKRAFYEKSFESFEELKQIISQFSNS